MHAVEQIASLMLHHAAIIHYIVRLSHHGSLLWDDHLFLLTAPTTAQHIHSLPEIWPRWQLKAQTAAAA